MKYNYTVLARTYSYIKLLELNNFILVLESLLISLCQSLELIFCPLSSRIKLNFDDLLK